MEQKTGYNPPNDQITFRDIVLTIKEYVRELWIKKLWVLLLIVASLGLLFYWAYSKPVTYSAKVTFMLNEEQSSGGALQTLLGSFGIASGNYNLLKVTELCRSRRIIQESLFQKATIKGKEDYLANHLIREEKIQKKWKDNKVKELIGFYFKNDSLDHFSRTENKALLYLYTYVAGNPKAGVDGILEVEASDISQILLLTLKAQNEELAVVLSKSVFNNLGRFYTEKATEQKKAAFDLMRYKRDSLYRALTGNDYALSSFNDNSLNPIRQTPMVPSLQMTRKTGILTTAYAQAVTNTELAEYSLAINTPFVQVIDLPIMPLSKDSPKPMMLSVVGVLLGIFVSVIIFSSIKFYRYAMRDPALAEAAD